MSADVRMECELAAGVWDDISVDVDRDLITAKRGIFEHGPLARVAEPGLMGFALDNSERTESGRPAWLSNDQGRYSPGHANIWTRGSDVFKHGKRVRLRIGMDYHYSQLILAHDPIAYYRMNAKAGTSEPNVTGHMNPGATPGTYSGGFTLRQNGRTADADLAVDFDGTNGAMTTPLDETDIPNTAWTLEAWFQTSETGTIQPIIFRSNTTFRPGLYVTTGNVLAIASHDGSTLTTVSSAATVTDGEWHHAVGTYDGTTLRLYLDGASVGTPAAANGYNDASTETFAVATGGPIPDRFNGLLDEVALYAHCLSASQIKEHFEAASYPIGYADMVLGRIVDPNNADDPGDYQPVAFYRLGEASGTTAVDEVGKHPSSSPNGLNAGTYVNTPTLGATGAISDGDTAVTFTAASSEHVTTPLDETDIPNTGWSLEAWFKTSTTGATQPIIARTNVSRPMLHVTTGNVLRLVSNDGTTSKAVVSPGTVTNGEWHHAVATYDGTTLRLYLDGVSVGTPVAANGYLDTSSSIFTVGRDGSAGSNYFNGSLDEVAFYDFPLTAAQVSAHYAARTSKLGLRAGIIRYPFSGRLTDITPMPDTAGKHRVECIAMDWMGELSDTNALLGIVFGDPLIATPPHNTQELISDVIDLVERAPENKDLGAAPDDTVFIAFDDLGDGYHSAATAAQHVCMTDLGALFCRGDGTDGETVEWQSAFVRSLSQGAVAFTQGELLKEGGIEVPSAKDRVYNDVRTRIWPRRVDSSAVVLVGPLDHELPVAAGETVKVWASYSNPDENSQLVGATGVVTPVANTDWVANATSGGGGTDVTGSVSAAVTDFGSRVLLEWTNNSGAKAYIRGVSDEGPRLQGQGIYRDEAIEYPEEDATSIADFGRRPIVINMYYNGVYENVEGAAVSVLAAYKNLTNVPTVVRPGTLDPAILRRCLDIEIGDPITVSESLTGVDAETLRVNAVEYEIRKGIIDTTYTVEPVFDLTP